MERNKLGVLSDLTRESNKLGVLSDLTMESNNWMFGQTWPGRAITGCLVRLDHGTQIMTVPGQVWQNTQLITLQGQVWQNTQLLLSMFKSDQTTSYYSPWSSLTKHPVIILHGQVDLTMDSNNWVFCKTWPWRVISWVFGQTWPWRVITGCLVRLDHGE
jgi:hypothetical protein